MATVKLIIQLLPELISLLKTIGGWVSEGMTVLSIKKRLRGLDEALKIKDGVTRVTALDDLFRK